MVSQKYIKDYRLEYVPNKKGSLKPVPVYIGKHYCFEQNKQIVSKSKRSLAVLYLVVVFLFLAPLLCESLPSLRKYYILLPYAVMVFPVFFAGCGLFNVLTSKDLITREKHDKGQPRVKASAFLAMLLSFTSAVGQVVYMIKNNTAKGSVFVFSCTLGCCICFFVMFLLCRNIAMKEKILFPGGKNE